MSLNFQKKERQALRRKRINNRMRNLVGEVKRKQEAKEEKEYR